MKNIKNNNHIVVYVLCLLFVFGFNQKTEAQAKKITQEEHLNNINELKLKRDSTLAVIKEMPVKSLVMEMDKDAVKHREPFNSPAYREITRNRKSSGDDLLKEIENSRSLSYISILALRKVNKSAYDKIVESKVVCATLLDEFAKTKSYNMWGLPHLYWEDAAKAIIECGKEAESGLKQFLSDKSPAPVWGSETYLEYETYLYRRCDYALAMILAIRGNDIKEIPISPEKRDAIIKELIME
jgi:hypothetical protein